MNFTFRSRLFLYLLLLLGVFIASQTGIYILVEWIHSLSNPYETMREGLVEVAEALGLTLLLTPMLIWVAWAISRRMIRPLQAVSETATRIRRGHWSERIETGAMPDDETKSLAESVNAAFDGYAGALRRLERFSGDAAHQLRTPIAAMRSLGEVALSRPRPAEAYREALETMLGELDHLTRIVEQLLQLSRLDAGALRARFVPVKVAAAAEQVRQMYEPLAEARGVDLRVQVSAPELCVAGIEELIIEVLGNLVDNALRHTPAGGHIRIEAERVPEDGVRLCVTDSGPGIPVEFARTIFDRFAQVPGRDAGAAGLGLSLAAEIAAAHGGTLRLTNPGQPGARFEVRWPAGRG
jgi:signal transduction histidine kinase